MAWPWGETWKVQPLRPLCWVPVPHHSQAPLPRVWHSYSCCTSLGSTLTQSSNYWTRPIKFESWGGVCWMHPTGTFGALSFWRSSWRLLNCVALERGPFLPHSSRQGGFHPQQETVLICPAKSWWPCPAELSSEVGKGVLLRAGTFGARLPLRFLSGTWWGAGWCGCRVGERGRVCLPPAGTAGTSPNRRPSSSVLPSPCHQESQSLGAGYLWSNER